jgi:hypothetical protein
MSAAVVSGAVALLRSLVVSAPRRGQGDGAPTAIRGTREFAGICPVSSAFMCRSL